MNKVEKRLDYFDIAKAIGIILVVVGHTDSPFNRFIYLFHMPLFFFISGYFYKNEYSEKPLILIRKRIISLYLPFVAYETLFLLLHNIFMKLNIYSNNPAMGIYAKNFYTRIDYLRKLLQILKFNDVELLAGTFWFLISLFTVNVFFCFISFISKKIIHSYYELVRFILILVCFIVGYGLSIQHILLRRSFSTSLVAIIFYYFGYLYKSYFEKINLYNLFAFLASFAVLVISSFYGSNSMSDNTYPSALFLLLTSTIGIYFVIYISKSLCNMNLKLHLLKYIGNSTIIIMALQFLSFKTVNEIQIYVYNYPHYMLGKFPIISSKHGWWILYSLAGIFIPVLIKLIIEKGKASFLSNIKIKEKNINTVK